MTGLKAALARGEKLAGCILLLPSPDIAEVLAASGLRVAMIDHEHGSGTLSTFIAQDRAISGTSMQTMVRVPPGDYNYARRLLDNGAGALVFPGVETAEQAQAVVDACLYPPRGTRGAGAGLRGAHFGLDAEYYQASREDRTLLVAQIESAQAVENVDAICAVSGIDMLLIGPRDLAASIGKLHDMAHPDVWKFVAHAADRIRVSGKYLASTLHPGRSVSEMFAAGYDLVLAGKDVDFLMAGAQALADQTSYYTMPTKPVV